MGKTKKKKKQERMQEHLSFNDFEHMMKDCNAYKRTKGGAIRQVRHE